MMSPPISPIKEINKLHDAVDAPICKQVQMLSYFHTNFIIQVVTHNNHITFYTNCPVDNNDFFQNNKTLFHYYKTFTVTTRIRTFQDSL